MSTGHDQFTRQDPVDQHARPGSGDRVVTYPGHTGELDVRPDHGENTYRGSGRLVDRKTIVTGGDSGIGRAVALAFAREGADVLISHLESEQEDAEETLRLVRDAGRTGVSVPGDLRDEDQCGRVVERAVAEFGQVDILVANAGYQCSHENGIFDIGTDDFDRVFKTNVYALFWLVKAVIPHMEPGSSIITTSSVQAFNPSPHLLDYATSKAAIVNFTKGLGANLVSKGIRANSVAPGPVWTPLIPSTFPRERLESFGAQSPMGRAGQPAELAPIYVFLASQESSYMTSEVLGVTGGTPIT